MDGLWPWLAIAGGGALHGLNPAGGWLFAAAWALRAGQRTAILRALAPLAAGHAVSVVLVGAAVAFAVPLDRQAMLALAAGMLVAGMLGHCSGSLPALARARAGQAGLALWSFVVATAHGAGLVAFPALMPLCFTGAGDAAASSWRALAMALAAVLVHMAAMLAVTAAVAGMACRGVRSGARMLARRKTGKPADAA
ncbi:hypothetical protein [Massilia sp. METH4]|uniref:hypothetical protein n=1 Tax=Massilia sp. METH4 TaxID=3123041 RepID=UPI0030D1DC2F